MECLNFWFCQCYWEIAREVVIDYECTHASICFKRFRESNHNCSFFSKNFSNTVMKVNFKRYIQCSEGVRF